MNKPYFEHCPACGRLPKYHDDNACEFRYYNDEVNHESGWISPPDSLYRED